MTANKFDVCAYIFLEILFAHNDVVVVSAVATHWDIIINYLWAMLPVGQNAQAILF